MKITGILSISNATGLNYPFLPVVYSLTSLCDDILVGVDPAFPMDEAVLKMSGLPVTVITAPWDRSNNSSGSEIALQMQKLVDLSNSREDDWVVALQADELIHEKDAIPLREKLEESAEHVVGVSMKRLYFWKNFQTVREDWSHSLTRVFRPRTHTFIGGDGMFSHKISGGTVVIDLPFNIYHYSRIGDPSDISSRVRNLDTFFHNEDTLVAEDELPEYDFVTREYDNYSKVESPIEVLGELVEFNGTHPKGIKEWYE